MEQKEVENLEAFERNAIIFCSLVYIAAILFFSYLTSAELLNIFIGTTPTLLYLLSFFLFFRRETQVWLLWLVPLIFPAIFFFVWYTKSIAFLSQLDGPQLSILNLLICYSINIFLLVIIKFHVWHQNKPKVKIIRQQDKNTINEYKQKLNEYSKLNQEYSQEIKKLTTLVINQNNIDIQLRSIEDKCKAINFVIGRVYSNKHGGTDDIRSKLRIGKDQYNFFSSITSKPKQEDLAPLMKVLQAIYARLLLYDMPEKDIFNLKKPEIPISRNPNGVDKIIDVLTKNDKDPIMEYHSEAKEICSKLIDYLKSQGIN